MKVYIKYNNNTCIGIFEEIIKQTRTIASTAVQIQITTQKRPNKHNCGHAIESDIYCKSGNRWSGRVVFPTIYRLVIAKSLIVELSVKYIV